RPGWVRLDDEILNEVLGNIDSRKPVSLSYPIRNTDRTVGARISGVIADRYGDTGLPYGTLDLTFTGSAGQSFGAFLARGVRLHLTGEANDYVAKSMGGGEITIRPMPETNFERQPAVLVGNTVLYGATGGNLFVAGAAGER